MYLSVKLQMTRVVFYTIPVISPMVVETGTARPAEGHKYQEVGSAYLNLEVLRLDQQKRGVRS